MVSTDPLVVVAWWDPKRRTLIFNPDTIVCGILVVGYSGVSFVSTRCIEFDIPASALTVRWKKLDYACELCTSSVNYRLYLLPPVDGAPQLSPSAVDAIADTLSTAGDLGDLADLVGDLGSLADALGFVGALGDSLKVITSISTLRRAKRSREALKQQFALIE